MRTTLFTPHRWLVVLLLASLNAMPLLAAGSSISTPAADSTSPADPVAPVVDVVFSCSTASSKNGTSDRKPILYADVGAIHIRGQRIDEFRWESSLFRSTHSFDCSIDDSDGLTAELLPATEDRVDERRQVWRIRLRDARAARTTRGYDADHGFDCTIDLVRTLDKRSEIEYDGEVRWTLKPNCPALCGSRENFSTFSVNPKTGQCQYEH